MGDLPNDVDIHTKESRIALTKMIMRLFDLWQISLADQAALINRSPSTIRRYKNGECFADNKDMHDRVGNLLLIHKNLRILYPYNEDIVYRWVSSKNRAFDWKEPIMVMKQGFDGMIAVRDHLESRLFS